MTNKGYDEFVQSKISAPEYLREHMAVLGLCGESGEVADHFKKHFRGDIDSDQLSGLVLKELGDILFYISMLAHQNNSSLDQVMSINMAKLKSREERGTLTGNGDDR